MEGIIDSGGSKALMPLKVALLSAGLTQLTLVNNIYYILNGMRYFFGYTLMDYHEYHKNYNDI